MEQPALPSIRKLGFFLHAYQPARVFYLASKHEKFEIVPFINEKIYNQTYYPILIASDYLAPGMVFSLFGPLREWIIQNHPEHFAKLKEKLEKLPDSEFRILGDSYIHAILPLLPLNDQDMLIKIGKSAFWEDFGFEAKGFWLPELGVSEETLNLLVENGYNYVVLVDNQLTTISRNPVYIRFSNGREIAVFHFHAGLSYDVAFIESMTVSGDGFLEYLYELEKDEFFLGTDMETFGHHKKHRDQFLLFVLYNMQNHGFTPLNAKKLLEDPSRVYMYSSIREYSSWSCPHRLGRWTGENTCTCDSPSPRTQQMKKTLFTALSTHNKEINSRLDCIEKTWRKEFYWLFLRLRKHLLTGEDFTPLIANEVKNKEKEILFLAKIYTLLGFTSDGWFFGKDDSPERSIPQIMITEIEQLL